MYTRKLFPYRSDFREKNIEIGFDFYNDLVKNDAEYWTEGVGIEFKESSILRIESLANELHSLSIDYVKDIIESNDIPESYGFDELTKEAIIKSWKNKDVSLYGRFDFVMLEDDRIVMLEYNASTPTSLLESSIAQWYWLNDTPEIPYRDQFNFIHEELISHWQLVKRQMKAMSPMLYFSASNQAGKEDWRNIEYLMDTAFQSGINVSEIAIEDIQWNETNFVDQNDLEINNLFALYPPEWLFKEEFGKYIIKSNTRWIEPAWKLLLSHKAFLIEFSKRNPNHPAILKSILEEDGIPKTGKWIKKPLIGREGANVSIIENGKETVLKDNLEIDLYDKNGYVLQEYVDIPKVQGFYHTLGVWIVGNTACGMGIREDYSMVINNMSRFVPHYFIKD